MAAYLLAGQDCDEQTIISVMERISSDSDLVGQSAQFLADCFVLAIEMAQASEARTLDFRGLRVDGAVVGKIDLEAVEIKNVSLRSCVIEEVVLAKGYQSWPCDSLTQ